MKRIPLQVAILILFVTLVRCVLTQQMDLLSVESYLWVCSQRPALGYFDYPGMIAWMGWLSTALFGQSPLGVRAVMIAGGEDPKFIARRMIVFASEDVGNADPQALQVAIATARAVEFVGLPECRINLAQGVAYLARAPTSNASYRAIDRALAEVKERGTLRPPKPIRDASYAGAAKLGHGQGYKYPHDYPDGWVDQQYLPDELLGTTFYEPSDRER